MTFLQGILLIERYRGILSGSRAFGNPRLDSDWDFYMAESNVKKLAKELDARGERWDSCFLGSLTFWPGGKQIEVSYLFPRTKKQYDDISKRHFKNRHLYQR